MFRVEFRFTGFGNWSTGVAPVSAQGAWGQARGLQTPLRADEVRVVQSVAGTAAPPRLLERPSWVEQAPLLDLKV